MNVNSEANKSHPPLNSPVSQSNPILDTIDFDFVNSSATIEYIESIKSLDLLTNPKLLDNIVYLAVYSCKQGQRIAAVRSLGQIVGESDKAIEVLAGLTSSQYSNPSSTELRLEALQALGKALEFHRRDEIKSSLRQTALKAAIATLEDPALTVRELTLKILEPTISEPKVYTKVCQFISPDADFDKKLRVNFQVRVAAVKALSKVIEIPYVRDTFVKALNKPEPNFEVRLPLLDGLASLLLNQEYQLRQDDAKALFCLISRGDSTEAVQNKIKFSNRIFKRTNPSRYEQAVKLSDLKTPNRLQDILQGQPLVHFIYQHAGHLLKNYERPPLIDNTKIWPMHIRYFFNEGELRKVWAEYGVDSNTRATISNAIKEELSQYAQALEAGKSCEPKLLADFLALFVWTNDRSFHSELLRIKPFVKELNLALRCSEGFNIKELFDFYEVSYQQHQIKKRREHVGFLLREKTRHFDIVIADTNNRKDELRERLAIFQEALDLKIVTSESMTRLAKGLAAFFERDHRGYFEILHEIKETLPKMCDFLSLVLERAPSSRHIEGFNELSLRVLNGDTTDLKHAVETRDITVTKLKLELEKEYILKRIEFASSTLHYRFFRTPQGIRNFRHELVDFEKALEHKIIGEAQLFQLGGMLDLLFVETEKRLDFLKEIKSLTSTLSRPIAGLLLHAACEYAPKLRNRYSFKELTAAFAFKDNA